jgi:hypothetical protein
MKGPFKAAQTLAHALEQHRPHLPADVVPGSGMHRTAVDNAHRAMGDVRQGVAERAALQEAGTRSVMPLSMRETIELLERQRVGRFAYVARKDVPDVVPVNYSWVDGAVLIRSGPGPKLQAAQRKETVALEVDEIDVGTRTGCSAVVVGAAEVLDPRQMSAEVEVWAGGPHHHVIRIRPIRITGRRLG